MQQWTDADARFVATCQGTPLRVARERLHSSAVAADDAHGLGWVQLVAAAVPLITSMLGKKKARGPTPEQLEAQRRAELLEQQRVQREQHMAAALAQRDAALRAAQLNAVQQQAAMRQQVAGAIAQLQAQQQAAARAAAARAPAASPVLPLALAGAAGVALLFFLRR